MLPARLWGALFDLVRERFGASPSQSDYDVADGYLDMLNKLVRASFAPLTPRPVLVRERSAGTVLVRERFLSSALLLLLSPSLR